METRGARKPHAAPGLMREFGSNPQSGYCSPPMQTRVTIAHITDVHLSPVGGLVPRYWTLKRALGYANWMRRRRHVHQRSMLDRLCADLLAQRPDHVAVTGDLTNLGLPWEHDRALAWLRSLGGPGEVSVIPGNHDIYSRVGGDLGTRRWADYMASDTFGVSLAPREWDFPYVRRVGSVALVGVNSAVRTPPLVAAGELGSLQIRRLAALLAQLKEAGLFRLLMIHHPPLPGQTSPIRALRDAPALRALLAEQGAELVIHGHNHRASIAWVAKSATPVVGGASGSLARLHKHDMLGRYNLYVISGPPWRIVMTARGLAEPDGDIVQLSHQELSHVPAAEVS